MAIECVEKLRSVLDRLPDRDKPFALNLLHSVAKYKLPTVKQEYWMNQLYERVVNPPPKPKGELVGDLARIVSMFTTAKTSIKFPAVRFQTTEGRQFKISPAGANSTNAGCLYVKSDDVYLGKITPAGEFFAARGVDVTGVAESIKAFAENPEGAASSYGHSVGMCCFCGRGLTDSRSVEVGYGPICADKYGLSWGNAG